MSKKVKKTPSLTPEEKERRHIRALMRFKAIVRLVIANIYWLQDTGDFKISDNVIKNIQLLTRKKVKKSSLTLQEKAILNKPKEDRTEDDKQILNRAIGGLKCFRRYPPEVKAQLAAVTYFCYIPPGRQIVKQGHKAHAMYFMLSGEAAVTVSRVDKVLNEIVEEDAGVIEPGTMFGEVALIHNISRLATLTATAPCELLMIKKEDFDIVLKDTVMKAWEEIQRILNKFSYFQNWDSLVRRECSIMSRTKTYPPEEIVLGDGCGLPDYVYFITKGSCMMIEHMKMKVDWVDGVKQYKVYHPKIKEIPQYKSKIWRAQESKCNFLSRPKSKSKSILIKPDLPSTMDIIPAKQRSKMSSRMTVDSLKFETESNGDDDKHEIKWRGESSQSKSKSQSKVAINAPISRIGSDNKYLKSCTSFECFGDPLDVETHFIKVCDMIEGACFNIGENFVNRRVVAKVPTNCLLVPRYWILKNNKDNIWNRVQQFLNQHIPNSDKIFENFLEEQKFMKYRKRLIKDILAVKKIPNTNSIHNVPYSIRLKEGVDIDYDNI